MPERYSNWGLSQKGRLRTSGHRENPDFVPGAPLAPLLTVFRQLHDVAKDGAVPIEGADPGECHGVAVRGVQAGQ